MAEIASALRRQPIIGLDTSVFIYYVDDYPEFSDVAKRVLTHIMSGLSQGVTSVLTLMELSVRPIREGLPDVAREYRAIIMQLTGLSVVPVRESVALRAAELRAGHNLRPADALQIAACSEQGATAFVTSDRRLRRVSELEVIMLGDFSS